MFSVTISEKGGQQSQYEFAKPQITIGRMKGNDIVLPKGNVSKQHTRIFVRNDNFFVVDLKSTNGTYVNGRKVTAEQPVGESDKIYIGDFILQLQHQSGQQPQSGPPQPPQPPRPGSQNGGSSSGGGRHFPTVMDGGDRSGSQSQAPSTSGSKPGVNGPGAPSGPGGSGNFSMGQSASSQPNRPPQPSGPASQPGSGNSGGADGLRKTMGEVPDGMPQELVPEIEPLDEPATPTPTPAPRPSKSQSGQSLQPGPSNAGQPSPPNPAPSPSPSHSGQSLQPGPSNAGQPEPSNPAPSPSPSHSGQSLQPGPSNAGQANPSVPAPSVSAGAAAPPPTAGPSGVAAGAPALASQDGLDSEFDDEFHRLQQDLARVFFDAMPVDALSLDYPVADAGLEQKVQTAVARAVSSVGAGAHGEDLSDLVTKEALGLGPLEDYLDDPSIEAIYINAFDRIVIRRQGKLAIAARAFSHPDMLDLAARRLLGPQDPMPVSDEVRFGDGTRVHILMPPVAVDGPALTVRKPNQSFPSLDELVNDGALSQGMADFLSRAVQAGRSMVIAGPVSSGKTTLLSALSEKIPSASRVIALEQHSNLNLDQPNMIRLEASPASGFDMRYLLTHAVAMHPDRILLDQCRGPEAYKWVTAAASGTAGSMVTMHGSGALDALSRFESMCLLAADDISPRGLREQVARSVNLVVVLNNRPDGGFRVQQIAEVQGVDLDAFRLNDIFYFRVEGSAGEFHPTGYIPLFYEDLRHAGLEVDLGIFRE